MKAGTGKDVLVYSALSGLTFFLYNEASFLALDRLDAVSHSVANTLKRVVIIVASCIVFKTPMSLLGGIGSAVAVLVRNFYIGILSPIDIICTHSLALCLILEHTPTHCFIFAVCALTHFYSVSRSYRTYIRLFSVIFDNIA